MKVHDFYLEPAAPSLGKARETEETPASGSKRAGGAGGGAEPDRVRVSELSERLLDALQAEPAGRDARIAQLSGEYRAGTYRVDALVLSSRMVESALAGDA
jgi:anti-sigma28 factor (negative regulator of flagellin synthesis)